MEVTDVELSPAAIATTTAVAPAGGERRTNTAIRKIMAGLMLAMLLSALDQTIVSTALPTIAGQLGGLSQMSWVVTAYLLTSTVSMPLWGKLGDLHGRKNLFQGAIVIFLVGSVLAGLSQNMEQLIAFRALQGLGGGGLVVGAQAIISDVTSRRDRGRYNAYFGAVWGLASVAGPLVGGLFTDQLTWRWIFYVNVPVGLLSMVVIARVLHLARTTRHPVIDLLGMALLSAGSVAVILLTTWGGTTYPWASAPIIGLAISAAVLVLLFVLAERRAVEPVIPLELFRNRTFTVASAINFVIGLVLFGTVTYLPLYLQIVTGATPTVSGLQLLPLMLGVVALAIVTGRRVSRTGRFAVFPAAGTAVMALGMFLLSLLTAHTSYLLVASAMLVAGVGIGLVMQILVVAVLNAAPPHHLGAAASAATFFRTIGSAFGVAVFGTLFSTKVRIELAHRLPAGGTHSLGTDSLLSHDPRQLRLLPPPVHAEFVDAVAHALQPVFLLAVPVSALAFGLSLLFFRRSTAQQDASEDS